MQELIPNTHLPLLVPGLILYNPTVRLACEVIGNDGDNLIVQQIPLRDDAGTLIAHLIESLNQNYQLPSYEKP